MKVADYKILESQNPEGLQQMVVDALDEGWQPLGGIGSISSGHGRGFLFQAMVKPWSC